MRFDQNVILAAQRRAYDTLATPAEIIKGLTPKQLENYKTPPTNITVPAQLVQELPWVNTTNVFNFQFGSNAVGPVLNPPAGTPQLNNVVLGENDVFAWYGVSVYLGFDTATIAPFGTIVRRLYFSRGQFINDFALYTGQANIMIESNTPIQNISMSEFLETGTPLTQYDFQQGTGFMITNPQRIITGRISNLKVSINLQSLTGLNLSPNAVVSVRLHGALGLAS